MTMTNHILLVLLTLFPLLVWNAAAPAQQPQPPVAVLDRNGNPISALTDGDAVRLEVKLATSSDQPTPVQFHLGPDDTVVAECTVAKASDTCRTDPFPSLG